MFKIITSMRIALSRLGDQPAAIASFDEALKLKPDDVKV
ncbi:tetratricopeptide repeat protein [Methanococcoides burtonii]|nr:tetratricopeptide repeat protein [Methanococcoides burtonii]